MQMDVNLVLKWGNQDQWYVSLTYGYVPTPRALKGQEVGNFRSREHYLAWRPMDKLGVMAGLMDIVYGIRIPDHIASSRAPLGLGQNDQTHGVLIHYLSKTFEGGLHGFIGNLNQDQDLRMKGASFILELATGKYFKPGVSILGSKNDYLKKYLASFHTKVGYPKGSATLFEIGVREDQAIEIQEENTLIYLLWQNYLYIKRGLFSLFALEYLRPNDRKDLKILKFNLGLQYFLIQGVELRVDLFNKKSFKKFIHTEDVWDFLGQLHLWF